MWAKTRASTSHNSNPLRSLRVPVPFRILVAVQSLSREAVARVTVLSLTIAGYEVPMYIVGLPEPERVS